MLSVQAGGVQQHHPVHGGPEPRETGTEGGGAGGGEGGEEGGEGKGEGREGGEGGKGGEGREPVVYSNTVQSMVAILRAMDHLRIPYQNQERLVWRGGEGGGAGEGRGGEGAGGVQQHHAVHGGYSQSHGPPRDSLPEPRETGTEGGGAGEGRGRGGEGRGGEGRGGEGRGGEGRGGEGQGRGGGRGGRGEGRGGEGREPVVYSNTVQSMVAILRAMDHLGIPYQNQERLVWRGEGEGEGQGRGRGRGGGGEGEGESEGIKGLR